MKRWQFWLGVVISLVFIYLALSGLQLEDVWQIVHAADFIWLLPAVVVFIFGIFFRSIRWKILLGQRNLDLLKILFPVTNIGYFGNNVFPARAGEILRAVVLKQRAQIPFSESFASIIIERVFDGLVMLGFVLLNINIFSKHSLDTQLTQNITEIAQIAAIVFLCLFFLFFLIAIFPKKASGFFGFLIQHLLPSAWQKGINTIIQQFFDGLNIMRSPLSMVSVIALSIIIWTKETVVYWCLVQAFRLDLQFTDLLFLNGSLNIITSIPSAPGYIGTFDALGIAILSALGLMPEIAAGYILTLHVTLWLPVTLLGAFYFAKESIRWTEAIKMGKHIGEKKP